MHTRPLILSAVAGGLMLGVLASQSVPVSPRIADEPGWRALIQPQYQMAYTRAYSSGPEDATVSTRLLAREEAGDYTLPPEYAAAERFARAEAKAAAEAERRYQLAYAEAMRPLPEPAEARPVSDEPSVQLAEDGTAAQPEAPEPKLITVAALTAE